MGTREVKRKMRLQTLKSIKQHGWKWKNPPKDEGLRKAWRYIFDIPDHVPDTQLIRFIFAKEGRPEWSQTPTLKHLRT